MSKIVSTSVVVVVLVLLAAPAAAQPPPAGASSPPRGVTFAAGADFPTAYLFRGILQEDRGFIAQPYAEIVFAAGRGATVTLGTWNSPHTGPTGNWYEADIYASASFTAGRFKPGVLFTAYTSPNERFATVHELAAVLAVDDSDRRLPLSPTLLIATELSSGQADGGTRRGTYAELGVEPSVPLGRGVSLAVPVKLGLSLRNYYEGTAGPNRFGYAQTGVVTRIDLPFVGGGSWQVHGGIDVLWLGRNLGGMNGDRRVKPVAVLGFSFSQ